MNESTSEIKAAASCLDRVRIRLISDAEFARWNALVDEKHYLCSRLVGRTLRYVAELDGQWVGLMSFGQCAYHLQAREDFIGWTDVQRGGAVSACLRKTRVLYCFTSVGNIRTSPRGLSHLPTSA